MSKALIIAEKPSVAADISRALGGFTRQGDYFERDDYVVCSAVGHLVEIAAPEQFEVKRGKWSFAHLPVIPPHFDLHPIEKGEERLKLLSRLIRRKDVTLLINACDAGREGELIFRLIAQHAKAKQPIKRLWLQSMTPSAIRDAFSALRDDAQMLPLADAARCRSEADWLVGINGTRAMTAFNSRDGGFYLTTVGRVQTPTLALVVAREEQIKRFVARDYFEVRAQFAAKAGAYEGRWFDPSFRKSDAQPDARPERLWDAQAAQRIVEACTGQPAVASEESKPSSQGAPALFDLTTLQREANSRFGFSAKTTLSLAQALYEKHKVLTYPRTDSKALPEDYVGTVSQTMEMFSQGDAASSATGAYAPFAREILKSGWVRPNPRVFNNKEVSDHFAIIPTLQPPKTLSDAEQRIYDLVTRRFLAVFYPAAEYLVTTRITQVGPHAFKTEGRVLKKPGWLVVTGRGLTDDKTLPAIDSPSESVRTDSVEMQKLATRPPARYTEATLLSAMETAGRDIEDDELKKAMTGKGLGTPATRAAIIEGLINETYLIRDGRELIPTTKAFQLVTLLRGLGVNELTAPELTGEWEYKLALMERGQLPRETFMREIAQMTRQVVERAKNYAADTIPGDYATLKAPCPNCGGVVKENYRRFACTQCDFSITRIPGGRQLEVAEAEQLIQERTIGPLQGFRSRLGRPFAAILRISDEFKMEFDFGQASNDADSEQAPDFSDQKSLGACPKCGSGVFENAMAYVCEKSLGPQRSCDFRCGKIILQQEVSPAQIEKLLAQGRTDLLPGFVSQRTRRKFKAFLVRGADGKVGFEFEPRPARAAAGQATGTRRQSARTASAADGQASEATASAVSSETVGAKSAGAKSAKSPSPRARAASKARKPAAR
jgi:DNA topoisomerase-3